MVPYALMGGQGRRLYLPFPRWLSRGIRAVVSGGCQSSSIHGGHSHRSPRPGLAISFLWFMGTPRSWHGVCAHSPGWLACLQTAPCTPSSAQESWIVSRQTGKTFLVRLSTMVPLQYGPYFQRSKPRLKGYGAGSGITGAQCIPAAAPLGCALDHTRDRSGSDTFPSHTRTVSPA